MNKNTFLLIFAGYAAGIIATIALVLPFITPQVITVSVDSGEKAYDYTKARCEMPIRSLQVYASNL